MFNRTTGTIANTDPEIWNAIQDENRRQEEHIELIASENYTSPAVMAAQGSQLTNKYAEGYPGKRYYGGCEYVDVVEQLAIDRVKQLFGAEAANVQPNSGSQANQGVFFAMLKPGDTIMGMSLAHGGHLTHGSPVNMSGKWFNVVCYGLNEAEDIDYDAAEKLAQEHKPKIIIAGASAFALRIDFERLSKIAKSVGAYLMVDMAHYAGLIAAGVYPNPVPFADFVTTTTHKSLRGPRGGVILMKAEYEKQINSAIFPGIQGGPLMHVIAGKAVAFKEALAPEFKEGFVRYYKLDWAKKQAEFKPGITLPLRPFPGVLAVGVDPNEPKEKAGPPIKDAKGRTSTLRPWKNGSNMDLNELQEGSSISFPVFLKGGLIWTGDSHCMQGNGEVNLTALECSYEEIRIQPIVHKNVKLEWPRAETKTHWITVGFDEDLTEAMKIATRNAVDFLAEQKMVPMSRDEAYSLTSMVGDCRVTEMVDIRKGVHCMIPKSIFNKK